MGAAVIGQDGAHRLKDLCPMGNLRLAALRDRLRTSLWFLPSVTVTASVLLALVLSRIGLGEGSTEIGFGGTPEGARGVLSTVAGSTITVTSLTFSLTVVALQSASSQFSPRILRAFLADHGNQIVLSTFLSTFAFSLVTLRSVRGGSEPTSTHVPDVAMAVAMFLTALSVAMLVYFFHHITQQLRVETILEDLQESALGVIRTALNEGEPSQADLPTVPDNAFVLPCRASGYLQTVQPERLLELATDEGVVIRLRPMVGGACTEGTTLAWVWPVDADAPIAADRIGPLGEAVDRAVHLGFERTMQQDVAFGIRQIVDIAVRALSPGINDPATAVAVIAALSPVLSALIGRDTGHDVRVDPEGRVRVALDSPTFGELLALGCDQPRRYGGSEPAVLVALLDMLGDVAELAPHDNESVRAQVELTVAAAKDAGLTDRELERVEVKGARALMSLEHGTRAGAGDHEDSVEEPAG